MTGETKALGGGEVKRLLDLFCGAGGAAMGYSRAGFEVVGVDWKPQRTYPFDFIQADALEVLESWRTGGNWYAALGNFDAIHASPPCQFASVATPMAYRERHPNHIPAVRAGLALSGVPSVIENVANARRHLREPMVMLCGTMFGLNIWRHRYFEGVNFTPPPSPYTCAHDTARLVVQHPGSNAREARRKRLVLVSGTTRSVSGDRFEFTVAERREAMGTPWMTDAELDEAIPPVFTSFIGAALMRVLTAARTPP